MSEYSLPVHPAIAPAGSEAPQRTILETLHEWVVTVDHKRLGILYILYSTFFYWSPVLRLSSYVFNSRSLVITF
jgi:hypothetical protein